MMFVINLYENWISEMILCEAVGLFRCLAGEQLTNFCHFWLLCSENINCYDDIEAGYTDI